MLHAIFFSLNVIHSSLILKCISPINVLKSEDDNDDEIERVLAFSVDNFIYKY